MTSEMDLARLRDPFAPEDIEWRVQTPGDFVSHRHAAARQRKHANVRSVGVIVQCDSKFAPGVNPIAEPFHDVTVCPSGGLDRRQIAARLVFRRGARSAERRRGCARLPC